MPQIGKVLIISGFVILLTGIIILLIGNKLKWFGNMPLDFYYYIALDVFIYVGELTEIFRLIKSRNKKSGHLVFSTEHTENDGYHIRSTARYSHSKSYIENLCEKFDYSISHFSTNHLRKEKSVFLTGGIYVLSF